MLDSLHVKDLALIKETEIDFKSGLNILTGETGAGKSVVIGSVVLALGGKASKDLIRTGAESALAELIFSVDDERVRVKCEELGIDIPDDTIVISRKISASKSLSRINGETVSLKTVKELAGLLLDVYGQHEHQSLTDERVQSAILDDFGGEELNKLKNELKKEYSIYRELKAERDSAGSDKALREKELELAAYEVKDIEENGFEDGEDTELEERYRFMSGSLTVTEHINNARSALSLEGRENVSYLLDEAIRELKRIEDKDESIPECIENLLNASDAVFNAESILASRINELSFEPYEYDDVYTRIDKINTLKTRYGSTYEEIQAYKEKQQALIEKYSDYDNYMADLTERVNLSHEKVLKLSKKISAIRKKTGKNLEKMMIEALSDLSFAQVLFEIKIDSDETRLSSDGFDDIKWLISVNPGQELRPLSAIASGGELSRIMLGLKTVMADNEGTGTLIFDEIDAGISGKTAWQVSKKLGLLSRNHQIICITHLPQIASMADNHFLIEKKETEGLMGTRIVGLDNDGSIGELSRLLGSDDAGEAAIENAKALKKQAEDSKKSLND